MNPDCQNCPLKERVDRLEQKYSESRKGIYERLERIENNFGRNDERWANIKQDIDELKQQQATILAKINELTQKPARRWDTTVNSLISAAIGALFGALGVIGTRFFGGGM